MTFGEAMLANPLGVEYDCQLNNPSGDGWREYLQQQLRHGSEILDP